MSTGSGLHTAERPSSCPPLCIQAKAMEVENQQLKQALTQKTSQVKTLESRLTSTQLDLQESQEKVKRPHCSICCFCCSLLCSCFRIILKCCCSCCCLTALKSYEHPERDTVDCIQSRPCHFQLEGAADSNSSIYNFSASVYEGHASQ